MMTTIFALLISLIIFSGVLFYLAVSWGAVIYYFYYWFLLPIFTTLPEITFIQAIGLMFFISLFQSNNLEKKDETSKVTYLLLSPWFILLIGLILKIVII